jgi:hypothetical protein
MPEVLTLDKIMGLNKVPFPTKDLTWSMPVLV